MRPIPQVYTCVLSACSLSVTSVHNSPVRHPIQGTATQLSTNSWSLPPGLQARDTRCFYFRLRTVPLLNRQRWRRSGPIRHAARMVTAIQTSLARSSAAGSHTHLGRIPYSFAPALVTISNIYAPLALAPRGSTLSHHTRSYTRVIPDVLFQTFNA